MAAETTGRETENGPEARHGLRAEALGQIEDRLKDLRYPPGSRLTETQVAADLGMTKSLVREALVMLTALGAVIPRHGSGYGVPPVTMRDLASVCRHWARLEGAAAHQAASQGIHAGMATVFQDLMDTLMDSPQDGDAWVDNLMRLHGSVVWSASDDRIARDFEVLSLEITRLINLLLKDDRETLTTGLTEIVEPLSLGQADAAQSAVETYVERVIELVSQRVLASDAAMPSGFGLRRKS